MQLGRPLMMPKTTHAWKASNLHRQHTHHATGRAHHNMRHSDASPPHHTPAPLAALPIILPLAAAAPATTAAAPATSSTSIVVIAQPSCPEGIGALVELHQHGCLVSKLSGQVLDL
jgi:hypothetical protein